VGNCGPAKNHQAIIQALAHLEPLDPVYLHAGQEDGGEERDLARRLDVAHRCRFLGRVDDVEGLLSGCDVFVMPSHNEGLGLAALEAAAIGIPCVLAHTPGLSDLRATLGPGAIWIKPTAEGVARGVEVAAHSDKRDIGERMYESVAREYGLEVGPARAAQLYRSLAG
jgi:glycosyltransferase involved in cell wall biosynthesis